MCGFFFFFFDPGAVDLLAHIPSITVISSPDGGNLLLCCTIYERNTPTMTTSAAGDLSADWITLTTTDGPMRVYRVRPRAGEALDPPAGIIVLQEAFGVNDHIQDVTRRFAEEGYLASARTSFTGPERRQSITPTLTPRCS